METYDPMKDFWTRFFPFLFRQTPALIFMSVVVGGMWVKIGTIEADGKIDRLEIKRECAQSIAEMRDELRYCVQQKDTLIKENIALNRRVAALEARLKR